MEKINEILRGKIPHYLAVVSFLWVLLDVSGFLYSVVTNAPKKEREKQQEYVNKIVSEGIDRAFIEKFPKITGKVTTNGTNP